MALEVSAPPEVVRRLARSELAPLACVLLAWVISAALLPLGADVAPADEWIFVRSVEWLVEDGRLAVPDLAAMNLVGQTLWGAMFASLFGMGHGALRVSVATLTALGAVGVHDLSRSAGARPPLAAAAAGTFLFLPLTHVLGFSFMTDAPYAALVALASAGYARGVRKAPRGQRWLIAGSAFAGFAVLIRQHAVLLPAAVVLHALITHPRSLRAQIQAAVLGGTLPLTAAACVFLWFRTTGVPAAQQSTIDLLVAQQASDRLSQIAELAGVLGAYIAIVAVPLVVGLRWRTIIDGAATRVAAVAGSIAGGGVVTAAAIGIHFPYAHSWWGAAKTGADDVWSTLPRRDPAWARPTWTTAAVLGAAGIAVALALALRMLRSSQVSSSRRDDGHPPDGSGGATARSVALLLTLLLLGQAAGVYAASVPFSAVTTIDRYVLPLVPLALGLVCWALSCTGWRARPSVIAITAMAILSTGFTRDWLVYQDAVWSLGRSAIRAGAAPSQLIVSAGFDGAHLWDEDRAPGEPIDLPSPAPGWAVLWRLETTGEWRVQGGAPDGFEVVGTVRFDQWISSRPESLHLVRRTGAPEAGRGQMPP